MKIKVHRPLPAGVTEDEFSALLSAAGCSEEQERKEYAQVNGESKEPARPMEGMFPPMASLGHLSNLDITQAIGVDFPIAGASAFQATGRFSRGDLDPPQQACHVDRARWHRVAARDFRGLSPLSER